MTFSSEFINIIIDKLKVKSIALINQYPFALSSTFKEP